MADASLSLHTAGYVDAGWVPSDGWSDYPAVSVPLGTLAAEVHYPVVITSVGRPRRRRRYRWPATDSLRVVGERLEIVARAMFGTYDDDARAVVDSVLADFRRSAMRTAYDRRRRARHRRR